MSNKQKPTKKTSQGKYTNPKLYEGYYWLILHVDPYNFSYGFINEMGVSKEDIHPVPECIKDARKMFEETVIPDVINIGLSPNHPFYNSTAYPYVDVDRIFNWLLEQEIPKLKVDGGKIKQKEDVKLLWELLKIPDPVKDDDYEFNHTHFHKLEHYLEPQHKKNLETLASQAEQGGGKATETPKEPKLPVEDTSKIKGFFTKHWKWLVGAIIAFIGAIVPIIIWIWP